MLSIISAWARERRPKRGPIQSDLPLTADATQPAPRARPRTAHSLFLVAFLGWLVPGLGQLVVGRPRKALAMLLGIGALYAGGLALTGFLCVNPSEYRLEFVAHALAGGPTFVTLYLTDGLTQTAFLPHFDIGRLYVAVASLLNVVAVSDALGDAIEHNERVELERADRELEESLRATEAASEEPVEGSPEVGRSLAEHDPWRTATTPEPGPDDDEEQFA